MVYVAAGTLLGLYQMGSYRRGGHWLNLLHRPLHLHAIAFALCAAGACVLLLAIGLPVLLAAAYQVAFTARVVDMRHWLLPLSSLLLALCGYRSEERRVGKECRSRWWLSMSTNRHECIQLRAET